MNTPKKCPKCGDPLKDGWDNVYQCGSVFYTEGPMAGRFEGRQWCVKLQRDQLAERVRQLESVVTDPHALWSNWLRGDIQLPAGIGDIRECAEKMKRFRSRWLALHKRMMEMENEAERASERVKRLEQASDKMADAYEEILFDRHDASILEEYRKVRGEK